MLKSLLRIIVFILVLCALIVLPAQSQEDLLGITEANLDSSALITLEMFDVGDAWEHYSNPMGVERGVENGVYRAYTMNGGSVWGLNEESHTEVILEVEATS